VKLSKPREGARWINRYFSLFSDISRGFKELFVALVTVGFIIVPASEKEAGE
jgi:hypothetical protein